MGVTYGERLDTVLSKLSPTTSAEDLLRLIGEQGLVLIDPKYHGEPAEGCTEMQIIVRWVRKVG